MALKVDPPQDVAEKLRSAAAATEKLMLSGKIGMASAEIQPMLDHMRKLAGELERIAAGRGGVGPSYG